MYTLALFVQLISFAVATIPPLNETTTICSCTTVHSFKTKSTCDSSMTAFTILSSNSVREECSDTFPSPSNSSRLFIGPNSTTTTTLTVTNTLTVTLATRSSSFTSGASTETTAVGQSEYAFDADATNNIAVYFAQTELTGTTSLAAQCINDGIDIVILAFVTSFQPLVQNYPSVNFGAACGGTTSTMEMTAPGLLWCPLLAANISECQSLGKKVFLSIGGATGSVSLANATQAEQFGNVLWDLFGPPGNIDPDLRPFGNVTIDGFDFDIEGGQGANLETVGTTLRRKFQLDTTKHYFLSAAPQCPFPDASIPEGLINLTDFVWVQFYNNPPCEFGSGGFHSSLRQWAAQLPTCTKLYVGAPGSEAASPSTYNSGIQSPGNMETILEGVVSLGLPNLGGVMFWDGPEAQANTDEQGQSIIQYAKIGLNG